MSDRPPSSAGTLTLAAVALVAVLWFASEVLVPVALALLLVALLHPVVQRLRAWRVPAPAGAAIAVVGTLVVLIGVGALLEPPLRGFAADIPKSVSVARQRLSHLGGPFGAPLARLVGQSAPAATPQRAQAPDAQTPDAQTPNAQTPNAQTPNAPAPTAPRDSAGAKPRGPDGGGAGGPSSQIAGFLGRAFGTTTSLLASAVEVLLLALFVLALGDGWAERLGRAVPSPDARRGVASAVAEIRASVARYLLATALINLGQGIVVALVAWALHLPSPPLWGALTFVFEFVPYLGGAALMVLLLVIGLASGQGARALVMPSAYLVITTLQNNVVSPIVYGRGLRLNPVAILVAVMIWWALWGVAGAFLAVPILAAMRVLADRVELLRPVGPFLEG